MKRISALASAAALGCALAVSGSAFAASAPALDQALRAAQAHAYPAEAFMKGGRHGGGHHARPGGGYARPGGYAYRPHYRRHGGRGGGAVAAGVLGGLAIGLLGGAIASQQPAPGPVVVGDRRWVNYCARRFGPTFDPASGTYLGADGYRYPCR